jgi:hypothetical protein
LQPAHIPLDIDPDRGERVEAVFRTPAQKDAQVRFGVQAGLAAVAAEVGGHSRPMRIAPVR